jgi:LmbE family N-acetylglucosaminyl deacetylase
MRMTKGNSNKVKKFLVISPHPDDSDFGASGTIAKLGQEGNYVEYIIVSDGSKGSHVVGFGGEKLAQMRKQEQQYAAALAGVQNVTFLEEIDGEMENTPRLRKKLVAEIRKAKPDIVLSFDPSSLLFENMYRSHRDHRIIAETVFDAIYPAVGNISFFPELIQEGFLPHQIQEVWFFATPRPNKCVDINDYIDLKIQILLAHKSQHEDPQDAEKRLRNRAKEEALQQVPLHEGRGSREQGKETQEKIKCAECFRVVDFSHEHEKESAERGKQA